MDRRGRRARHEDDMGTVCGFQSPQRQCRTPQVISLLQQRFCKEIALSPLLLATLGFVTKNVNIFGPFPVFFHHLIFILQSTLWAP